jgi:pyrroline-5-carboxylate reductase
LTPPLTVSPSAELTNALSNMRTAIEAQPEPGRGDLLKAAGWVESVVKTDLDAVAARYLGKMPAFGAIADSLVQGAIDTALDEGLAQLTAAKSALSA